MSENQSLQVTGQQSVTVGEGLNDVFLRPTVMELVQRTSQKVTDPTAYGKLRDTLSGELYPTLGVIPLKISTSRVYFKAGSDFGSDPICRSDDGIVPSPFALVKQNEDCASCEKSQWFNNQRPPCQEQKKLLFLMEDNTLPYMINFKGASIKPFRFAMEYIYRDILSAKSRGVFRQLYDYRLDLKPSMVQGSKGTYYVLNLLNIKPISDPGKYGPMYLEFAKAARNVPPEAAQEQRTVVSIPQHSEVEDEAIEP